MKEIFEAIESRIRNPIFGYFWLALIAINWKAIFYLLVENKDAIDRISYFDGNTNFRSLLIFPILAAGLFSITYPWINYFFMYLCTKPTELRNSLQAQSEHTLLIKKQALEKIRSRMLSNAEIELIDRAKRDEELNKIEDIAVKDKLKFEIEQLRNERDQYDKNNLNADEFNNPHKLMEIASNYRGRAETSPDSDDKYRLLKRATELEQKAHEIIMNGGKG